MKRYSRIFIVIGLVTALIALVVTLPSISPPARAAGPRYVAPGGSDSNDCLSPDAHYTTMSGVITPIITFNAGDQVCKLTKHPGNPVLSFGPNGAWDDEGIWRPAVIKEGSSYKMWYSGADGSTRRIGYATSPDGLTWTKYGSNPVLAPDAGWESNGVFNPAVIADSGLYKMWYAGVDSGGVVGIGYATSPDGVAWTKYGSNPVLSVRGSGSWEDEDVTDPTALKVGSTYHLWYRGYDGLTSRIGHATSGDGITWVKDPANPVLDLGPSGDWDWLDVYGPSVIQVGTDYQLWYSGGTLPEAWQTGYALSSDGVHWTRQQMLIPEGSPGAFDDASADYPAVIAEGSSFKIWYSGLKDGGSYTIGYATAEICNSASLTNSVYLPVVLKSSGGSCPAYYTDDFSNPDSGWPVSDDSSRKYAYTGGQYQIWVKNPSWRASSTSGAKAIDFTAAVSAHRASGTSGSYGLLFGINEDWSEYYEFRMGVSQYRLQRCASGSCAILKDWTSANAIRTGTGVNRTKVIRQGANITVYNNNQYLAKVVDNSYTGLRRIGLFASSSNSGPLDVRFDDFSLYPASCGVGAAGTTFEMGEPGAYEAPAPPGLE